MATSTLRVWRFTVHRREAAPSTDAPQPVPAFAVHLQIQRHALVASSDNNVRVAVRPVSWQPHAPVLRTRFSRLGHLEVREPGYFAGEHASQYLPYDHDNVLIGHRAAHLVCGNSLRAVPWHVED